MGNKEHSSATAARPARLVIIAAVAPNGAIGFRGGLPWHLPDDLAHFKALTWGHAIIMGRRTCESLPHGALPGRRNIVVSRTLKAKTTMTTQPLAKTTMTTQLLAKEGFELYPSLEEALSACKDEALAFVIGGAEVYRQTLPMADGLCLTLVDSNPAEADAFFPRLNKDEWVETKKEKHTGFSFVEYCREPHHLWGRE